MPPPGTDPKTGHFEGGGRVIFGFLDGINYYQMNKVPLFKRLRFDMLSSVPWYAELTLKVKDVAVLLKSGLFWTEANIDPTNNFFDDRKVAPHLGSEWLNPINSYGRFYELRDTEPAQWHGTLMRRQRPMLQRYSRLNDKLKHEDTDDNLTQEDLDAKLKQEDMDDDSMLKDTIDDSMLEDRDDSDRDDDSMLKYTDDSDTDDDSMLEDTDDNSSDQSRSK
ncbi:hypothetical protein NHJ6243_005090 [Beauveria neobassiana]